MICGASIAKRDGSHRRCLLPPDHADDCSPVVIVPGPATAMYDCRWTSQRPARGELATIAGVHLLLVVLVILVCCLSGCDVEPTDHEGRAIGVGLLFFGVGFLMGRHR